MNKLSRLIDIFLDDWEVFFFRVGVKGHYRIVALAIWKTLTNEKWQWHRPDFMKCKLNAMSICIEASGESVSWWHETTLKIVTTKQISKLAKFSNENE